MSENKTAKTPTDSGTGFIDGVWYGPWYGTALTCLSSKPLKREWVSLTDEERRQILLDDPIDWIAAIEAKLKEKNT